MNQVLLEPAPQEPVSLAQARLHLRIDGAEENELLGWLIAAARDHAEQHCQRAIAAATYECRAAAFTAALRVPVIAVQSVAYIDPQGATQTLASAAYELENCGEVASLRLKPGQAWPALRAQSDAVRIVYTAGWAPEAVPRSVFAALLLLVGHLYENREAVSTVQTYELPMGAQWLLQPYRLGMGV